MGQDYTRYTIPLLRLGNVNISFALTTEDPFPVSASEVIKVGKSLESTIKYQEEKGGQYAANLEVFHQLHCLVSCPRGLLLNRRQLN